MPTLTVKPLFAIMLAIWIVLVAASILQAYEAKGPTNILGETSHVDWETEIENPSGNTRRNETIIIYKMMKGTILFLHVPVWFENAMRT